MFLRAHFFIFFPVADLQLGTQEVSSHCPQGFDFCHFGFYEFLLKKPNIPCINFKYSFSAILVKCTIGFYATFVAKILTQIKLV